MVLCKEIYIELLYFIKKRVAKNRQVFLINTHCHLSLLWLHFLLPTQNVVANHSCRYLERYANTAHAYIFVYEYILFILREETQFLEDLVTFETSRTGLHLNIYLLFTRFPSAQKPHRASFWPESIFLFAQKTTL